MSAAVPVIELGDAYLPLADGTCRDRFILIEGRRGTGKTRAILSLIVARARRCPGSRWLIARSTRTRLTESVLVTLEQQVFPSLNMEVPGGAGRENRHDYNLPNGSVLVAQGLDDPQRSTSAEYAGVYVAEGVELRSVDDVVSLAGSMRQARRDNWPKDFRHQCIVDCNPGAPGHWLNGIAEPIPKGWRRVEAMRDYERLLEHGRRPAPAGKWKRIVTCHQDNPGYFDVERWEWTEAGREYLATLDYLTGHLRRRWLDGDWVAADGVVFAEFSEERHCIAPFEVPHDQGAVYFATDPGYDHPTGLLWIWVAPNGCIYVIDCAKVRGQGIVEHAANVRAREKAMAESWGWPDGKLRVERRYGDPRHAFSQTAQSPKTIAMQWGEQGMPMSPWPRDEKPEAMVEAVRRRLVEGRLKVFSTCTEMIGELQAWSYKRTAAGEIPAGDDQYEDRDNDLIDPLRALCSAGLTGGRVRVVGGGPVVRGGGDGRPQHDIAGNLRTVRVVRGRVETAQRLPKLTVR